MLTALALAGLVVALLWCGVLAALFLFQDRLLFPADATVSHPGAFGLGDMVVVETRTEDGLVLKSWYKPSADPDRPTVLTLHGNGETLARRAGVARALLDAGYGVFQAEYRGYGGNPGTPDEPGLYRDARAALDFLERRGDRVIAFGYSLGTGVAVEMATERRLAALILEAPYTSVPEAAARRFPGFPVSRLMRSRFDSLGKIARVMVPLLICYGTRDRVVPPDLSCRLFAAANPPKRLVAVPGADHPDIWERGGAEAVAAFLDGIGTGTPCGAG